MKKYIFTLSFFFVTAFMASGQSADQLTSNCVINAGTDARYLKDFRVQLGATTEGTDFRYKANISLWKNTKYRFSMCNAEDSKGQLILSIKDESNKIILSSFDKNTGKTYSYVDFVCNRSGIYQLNYDFFKGLQGSGVGVVSMIK
jgi:hypothetical protein